MTKDVMDKYKELEFVTEKLVDYCNNVGIATACELIAVEAALERLYKARQKERRKMTKDDRLEIKLRLIEQLIENPNFEATPADMEYWEPIHDKLKNKLTTCEALARAVMMDQTSHDKGIRTDQEMLKEAARILREAQRAIGEIIVERERGMGYFHAELDLQFENIHGLIKAMQEVRND